MERLENALKDVKSAKDDFNQAKSSYDKTKITDSDWKGETRNKSNKKSRK